MSSEKSETLFKCKCCLREMIVEKFLFENVYKGQPLCVKCRIKEEKRNTTKAESVALIAEEAI